MAVLFRILSTCKGGGYRYCRTDPPHPKRNAKGLYPLHRVLMENHLGRILDPTEEVHHKNGDKTDDRVENYEVLTKSEHARHHAPRRLVDRRIAELAEKGMTSYAIAKALGYGDSSVYAALRRMKKANREEGSPA